MSEFLCGGYEGARGNIALSFIYSIVFAVFGFLAVVLFDADIYFPITLSLAIFVFVSLFLLIQYRQEKMGMLMLLIWLVYALPFIHIPPYMFFDFSQKPFLLWGLVVNPYMLDERVITLTAMIGAVGALGIAFGASLNNKLVLHGLGANQNDKKRVFRTMEMPIWSVWVVVGVVLSVLSAPQETIFTAAYTQSKSVLDGANFSSAWMMSYVILSFAFSDALLERKSRVRYLKLNVVLASIILIVVFFQLLRGDRESISWVFGLAIAYYYWAAGITQPNGSSIPWLKLAGVSLGLVALSMVVGGIRSGLTGASLVDAGVLIRELYESDAIGLANATHGTWSAVLLTPLSVAGDHIYGLLSINWGRDYVNLFLSIIPGFMADAIGYVRPIDSAQGPAWEMRYGLGGTHATVLPFLNFRMLGVFLIPSMWTLILINYEEIAIRRISVIKLSMLVTIAMASPHWLWYGEKSGLNALVMWFILAFFYRVSLGMSRQALV